MKYLPIKQTILKKDGKFLFQYYEANTLKYEFNKVTHFRHCNEYQTIIYNNDIFIRVFSKYMNHDVNINWN